MAVKDLNSKVDLTTYTTKVNELQNSINAKASKSVATTTADGLMSSADKTKLNGIATGANNYTHPTTSGNKHIPSGGSSGQILRWSADGTAVWGNDNNTTYSPATTSADGLMAKADKSKLDGIATGANNYIHPTTSGNKHIPSGGVAGQFLKWSADGTAVWANDNNTTYSPATTSANGLMSSADKTKLDGITTGANNYTHPTTSGNKHIPSGGASGQYLKWSADGTATWATIPAGTAYSAGTGLTLSGTTFSANIGTGSTQVAAGNHTHSYLPLAGGTITGSIKFNGGGYNSHAIRLEAGDSNGAFIGIGAGGLTVIGSGESTNAVRTAITNAGDETMIVASDQSIRFLAGVQSGYDAAKEVTITSAGVINAPQGMTGNASTASKLATARTIALTGGVTGSGTFDGSGNLSIATTVAGNAPTASKLATVRTINGTNFDGSTNITTTQWGTARNLQIGNSVKSVNGSTNITWSLSEIGAAASSHNHNSLSYTSLSGKTVSLNTYTLSSGSPQIAYYYCPTDGDGANITGRPSDSSKNAFNLKVELIRWASSSDYISKQTYIRGNEKVMYVRYCTNGTWSSWEKVYTSVQKPTASEIGALASRGTAVAASKLATARTITLGNHLSGSTSFDGSANITLSASVRSASTSQTGIVQLSDATNSTSTTLAATANAVKKAYDLANGKANASHGNHVPATETANNAKFLRNDNTWQTVTPANIGAMPKSQAIPANSDLNNYKTEGFYYCSSSATAGTIKNVASGVAFSLLVERHAGYRQTFTTYNDNGPKTWYRNFYSNNWGAWQRVFDSFMVSNGESMGSITASKVSSASGVALQLQAGSGNILACSRIYPNTDGDKELGVSGYRWLRVFAVNGTIQTSDSRYKTRIHNADELDCFEMIKNVDVCTYTMINKDKTKIKDEHEIATLAEEAESDSTSTIQMGIMAQDLLPYECSKYILTHDITEKENGEISDIYGINPYNFSAAIMSALKTEISYREKLEEKLEVEISYREKLEEKLEELKQEIKKL